jgi:predicted PurR-regulated permease PerM
MKEDKFYRNLLVVIITIITISVIYQARSLLTSVFSALLVAYILYPIMNAASRIGIPRGMTILMIFVTIIGAIIYIGSTLIPAVKYEVTVLSNPDKYKEEAQSKLVEIGQKFSKQLQHFGIIQVEWKDEEIIQESSEWIAEQSTFLLKSFGGIATKTGQFLMIFFFVLVFGLLDGDRFYKTAVQLMPNSFFEPGVYILKKTTDLLGHYLRGLVVENLILGIVSFVLLLILSFFSKLPFVLALVIAMIIAITNVIRIIGPIIGAVVGILLVLITSTDFVAIGGILAIAIVVQLLDNVLILPLVMKEQVKIHPVWCVLGVLTGGILAGALGMMLAIPVIGSVKVIYRILSIEMKKFNMDPEPPVEMIPRQIT